MTHDEDQAEVGSKIVVANLDSVSAAAKVLKVLALRPRLALARVRLKLSGTNAKAAAAYPSLSSPTLVYELTGSARRYAERRLIPSTASFPKPIERLLAAVAGCSPRVGAVVLAGPTSMLNAVPAIVATVSELNVLERSLSVAEVHTTRRLYLIFNDRDDCPAWVVQFGTADELSRLHVTLTRLHPLLPDLVPEAIALKELRSGVWIHVQQGLPGLPWFRLREALSDARAWLALRARAAATLVRFQAAVRVNPEWSQQIAPGDELRKQADWYRDTGRGEFRVLAQSEKAALVLDRMGMIHSAWQHGDYCLNNLLVAEDRLGLIDFEEFGHTSMLLHDEMSLAFSTHDFVQGLPGAPSLGDLLSLSTGPAREALGLDDASIQGLLLHHLIWRLRQCADRARRSELAAVLQRQLVGAVDDPAAYGVTG